MGGGRAQTEFRKYAISMGFLKKMAFDVAVLGNGGV